MNWTEQIAAVFSWLPTEPKVMFDGWGLAVVIPLLGWLYACLRKPKDASIEHDASEWLAKNRRKLLGRFQSELKDRRQSFLLGHTALELDKNLAPNQVSRPYSFRDRTDCTWERDGVPVATTDQPIVDLFCRPDVGEQLAILGKPGSGKTVCLLTLLEHLLQTAQDNDAAPLPVVFECSEWDGRELSLWMAAQLRRKYSFPEDMARHLVQAHDILPLLDGLDELATEKQGNFVSHFNAFADNRPLALCCRLEEYRQLRESEGQKLALRNAAILQDITPQRLKGHLLRTGLEDIWTVLEQSRIEAGQPQSLLELAQRPLFLGVMIEVAQDLRQGSGRQPGETWKDFLWRNHLNKWLNMPLPACGKKYSQQQSLHWLRCLAKWMQAEQKVELRIEELQPSMLKENWRFCISYGQAVGLAGGLFFGLVFGLAGGLACWLTGGVFLGLRGIICNKWASLIITGLAFGLAVGLAGGLAFGLAFGLPEGLVLGLTLGLTSIFMVDNQPEGIDDIHPLFFPSSVQDWKNFGYELIEGLVEGVYFGFFVQLTFGFIFGWFLLVNKPSSYASDITIYKWERLVVAGLSFELAVSLVFGLVFALAGGLKGMMNRPIINILSPGQAISYTAWSSVVLLPLISTMVMSVLVYLFLQAEQLGLISGKFTNMTLFFSSFAVIILYYYLILGANTVLRHYLLRLCLWQEKQLPLRLIPWLEAMQQRKVLQQVGGSYHFLHKQLQEYLAKSKVA
uniref:NACHT domain-containing protein n=1 Tax=Candidatus Electronema sp. TaxID=2698783 RepID=UPI0040573558